MVESMRTASGEEHGLINVLANSVPDNGFKHMTPEARTKAEKMKKDDAKMVKAKYINYRGINERLEKPYCKYAGDRIQIWKLIPNEVYELPYGFVKEINESRGMPVRSEILDGKGVPTTKDGASQKIHELIPISF